MAIELGWGRVRRWLLKRFWPRYVKRMQATRRGTGQGLPYEIIDSRDLKYFRNQIDYYWEPQHDPFAWRDRLPLARVGLAEVVIGGFVLLVLAAYLAWWWWPAAAIPLGTAVLIGWFFRDPRREVVERPGVILAPADGRITSIEQFDDDFIGGPAVCIGIFLSVLNVHINRSPTRLLVLGQTYRPGKFLNALRPQSARENEQMELRLQEVAPSYRRMRVRQIAGAIARRIVCWAAVGQQLAPGQKFGMIKIGSRTEIVLPRNDLTLNVQIGDPVRAGITRLATYNAHPEGTPEIAHADNRIRASRSDTSLLSAAEKTGREVP
jgi:phosphatidylserine decarboxylase